MKLLKATILSALLLFGLACLAYAGEDQKNFSGEISIGGTVNNADDHYGRAAEYESGIENNRTYVFGGKLNYIGKDFASGVYGDYRDADDQHYGGYLDFRRILLLDTNYLRFYHRLDHDNLDYMNAILSGAGATVYSTDFGLTDFGRTEDEYHVIRSTAKTRAKINVPMIPGLSFTFEHWYEERKGLDQARTLSKCSACHVVGRSKRIHEFTNEWSPSFNIQYGIFTLNYKFLYRTFNNSSDIPHNLYDETRYPGEQAPSDMKAPSFDTRVQFDNTNGLLPYARTPDSERFSHILKAKATLPNQVMKLGFVYTQSKNHSSNDGRNALYGNVGKELQMDYWAGSGGWHVRLNRSMAFTLKGKYLTMDGDEASIKVTQPQLNGQTYADWLGIGNFDFRRQSAYDQKQFVIDGDFAWRLNRALKFRFGYEVRRIDRKHAKYFSVEDDETTKHKVSVNGRWEPWMGLRFSADYTFTYTDNPYTVVNAMCPKKTSVSNPGVFSPTSSYSKYIYEARTEDRSNDPRFLHDVKLNTTWSVTDRLQTNAHAHYIYGSNNDIGGSNWNHNMYNGGVDAVYVMGPKFDINAGYNFFYDKYEAMFCSAFFHGGAGGVEFPQVGGQNADIKYKNRAHTAYLGFDVRPIHRLGFSATASYSHGKAGMNRFSVPNDPFNLPNYSFKNLKNMQKYSDLDYNQWEAELSGTYDITKQLAINVVGRTSIYTDNQEYVYGNLNGEVYSVSTFLTYRF